MTGVQTCALPICFPVTIGAFEIWRILDFGTTAATHKGIGPCTVKVVYDPEKTNMMSLSVDPLILDEVEAIGSEGVHSFIQNENSSLIFDVPWYSPRIDKTVQRAIAFKERQLLKAQQLVADLQKEIEELCTNC